MIEISSKTNPDELIQQLKENDSVYLKWGLYTLIAARSDPRLPAGTSTFSEFKWGRDAALQRYIEKGDFSRPWLIRSKSTGTSYDWIWTGGERFELKDAGSSSLVNCFIVGGAMDS